LRDIADPFPRQGPHERRKTPATAIAFGAREALAHHEVNASNGAHRSFIIQRRDAQIPLTRLFHVRDILIVTSYRLALALPLLIVLVSGAQAQGTQPAPQQAPAAAAPADQQAASDEPIGNVATLTGSATVTRNKGLPKGKPPPEKKRR
jgi:hypothetical protein